MRFSVVALGAAFLGVASAASNSTCVPTAPSCPSCAGSDVTGPLDYTYTVLCPGVNARRSLTHVPSLKRQAGPTFAQCIATCDVISGCQSVLYDPLTAACTAFTCLVSPTGSMWGAEKVGTPGGAVFTPTACPPAVPATTNVDVNVNVNVNGPGGASVGVYVATVGYNGVNVNVVVTTGAPPNQLCAPGSGATLSSWGKDAPSNSTKGGSWGSGSSGSQSGGSWGSGSGGSPSGSGSGSWGSGSGGSGSQGAWTPVQNNDGAIAEACTYLIGGAAILGLFAF